MGRKEFIESIKPKSTVFTPRDVEDRLTTVFTPRDVVDSSILIRTYTQDDCPDRKSPAYKRMKEHEEKIYRFDELDR